MSLPDRDKNEKSSLAVEFLKALFGNTEQSIFLQTLANDPADADEAPNKRHLISRDIAAIERFVHKHDRARRGMFVCVGTVNPNARQRSKDVIAESVGLHADVDFKSIAETEAEAWYMIGCLEAKPTVVVRSGGGAHLYWLFREPIDAQEHRQRLEGLLRALAEVLAGDVAVCEISRLMRLPGTHNSKYGDMREVVVEWSDGPRYELEGLEEWLEYQRPMLTRKAAPEKQGAVFRPEVPANPYLALAARFGYRPRLDADAALAEMAQGNIHDTLLRVSASLISSGRDPEEVVMVLMEASRSVAAPDWDWRVQEKEIREMCAGALKKFPPKPQPSEEVSRETDPPPNTVKSTVNLGEERAKRAPLRLAKGGKINHLDIGELFLAGMRATGQLLMFTETQGSWLYDDGLWRLQDDRTLRAWLDRQIEQCILGTPVKSKLALVNETRAWLMRHDDLYWGDRPFDGHGQIPTKSGLVDPLTGVVSPPAPEQWCTWRVPFDYDAMAACPHWLQLLEDAFADRSVSVRAEYIQLLQEWLGMALLDERAKSLSCILFFQGGSDYGKSEIINVLAGMFGPRRNTTPIDMLDTAHGLMAFAKRSPWVLPEAFDQGKWHFSSVTKALASGEPIQINMKNGAIFDHIFTGPIIWGANSDPQFKEATAAITNRILIVPCRRKFDPEIPVGVAIAARAAGLDKPSQLVLRDEMPGVLAWAIEGLIRVRARGYFLRPEESRTAAKNVQRDNNIVLTFVEDCVDFDPDGMVSVPDFAAAFASWWVEIKGNERGIPGSESVSKALKSLADPRIAFDLRNNSRRYYAGIHLNDEGRRYWSNTVSSEAFIFQGRKASTTESGGDPNRSMPASWDGKEVVRAMRSAHKSGVTVRGGVSVTVATGSVTGKKLSPTLSPSLSSTQLPDFPDDIPY